MNPVRARRLVEQGIRLGMSHGWVMAPPETGHYLVMGITLTDGGPTFSLRLSKLTEEQLIDLSGGTLTTEQIHRTVKRAGHFPVFTFVMDGDDGYSEITEVRIDVNRVGSNRPFESATRSR